MCWDPFYSHGLTLISAWISNHKSSKVWHEIPYPFPNFNSCTVEVWEWISNFVPHYILDVNYSSMVLVEEILPHGRRGLASSTPRMLMSLQCKEPGHQQPWYWLSYAWILWFQHWGLNKIQSSAVIVRSKSSRYCILHCDNSARKWTRY